MEIPSETEIKEIVKQVLDKTLSEGQNPSVPGAAPESSLSSPFKRRIVAVGADHGGYQLKDILKAHLTEEGFTVIDCGTNSGESVDYPDFAYAVAQKVSRGEACCGVIVDGAGIGSCMAANKVKGVRAALCYDHATASNAREHNHANVLTLGAGLIGVALAKQIVDTFMSTEAGGGRHARRVEKIMEIENK
jgi:RpiB/LacA/LacB family sugar-phosphate isomerase